MQFNTEKFSDCMGEISILCVRHWEEIAWNKDSIPLDPDWNRYLQLDNAGMLDLTTARNDDGDLVGYQIYFVMPHIHYKNSITAMSDVLYLAPEYREGMAGIKLMKHAEKSLRNKGVQRVMQNVKLHNDWGKILERLEYKPFERIYAKML